MVSLQNPDFSMALDNKSFNSLLVAQKFQITHKYSKCIINLKAFCLTLIEQNYQNVNEIELRRFYIDAHNQRKHSKPSCSEKIYA